MRIDSSFRYLSLVVVIATAVGLSMSPVKAQDSLMAVVFLREDCVICQEYMPRLNELSQTYAAAGVSFIGLFPNHSSDWADIGMFRDKYRPSFPLQADERQYWAKRLGAAITPEVVLYNPATNTVLYRGRIDNRYAQVGRRRRAGLTPDLEIALQQWVETGRVTLAGQPAIGCLITFDEAP